MKEKIQILLNLARLAPSSHNTQPWFFRVNDQGIEVLPNPARRLVHSDPSGREFYLSLGTAAANLALAASALGAETAVVYKEPEKGILVRIGPFKDMRDENLLKAVAERQTCRFAFEPRQLPEDFTAWVKAQAREGMEIAIVSDRGQIDEIRKIGGDATEEAFNNRNFSRELSHWIKPSLKKYRDGMPGYNIGVPWLMSFIVPFALRYFNLSKMQRKMHEAEVGGASSCIVIATSSDEPKAWMEAGTTAERIMVEAQKRGIKTGMLAASVEIGQAPLRLKKLLSLSGRPQIFMRIGYTTRVPKSSPRLPVEEVIV